MRLFPWWHHVQDLAAWLRLYRWWLLAAWLGLMGLIYTGKYLWHRRRRGRSTLASAAFATRREMRKAGLFEGEGVILGEVGPWWNREYVRVGGEHNVFVIGPKGSGKTVGITLKAITSLMKESLVILDLKGELVRLTRKFRERIGPTYVLALGFTQSDRLNLNDLIRWGTPYDVTDAMRFATHLATAEIEGPNQRPSSEEGQYYRVWARIMLAGGVLYIHDEPTWTGPRSCRGLLTLFSRQGASVRKTIEDLAASKDAVVREIATLLLNRSAKDQQEVFSAAARWLFPWIDPVLAYNTDETTIPIDELQQGTDPMTLYLRFRPDDIQGIHRPVARLIIDMMATRLTERVGVVTAAAEEVRAYRHPLKWIFEDMAMLGYFLKIENLNEFYREHGFSFLGIVQSINQIWRYFGHDTSLFDNVDTLVVFRPNNPDTQEFFARKADKTTIQETIEGTTRPQLGLFGTTSSRTMDRERFLMNPGDFGMLDQDEAIAFISGPTKNRKAVRPCKVRVRPYFRDWHFKGRVAA